MSYTYDVFLSHSSKDKTVVRELAERLKKDGLKVWFDEWEIRHGDNIPAKVDEGLEQSRFMVLCMSANAFGSDWAKLEGGFHRFKDPLNKRRRLLPLRLDDTPIKASLEQFLYLSWLPKDREQEYPKLLEDCRQRTDLPDLPQGPSMGPLQAASEATVHREPVSLKKSELGDRRLIYLVIFGSVLAISISVLSWNKSWQETWPPIAALLGLFVIGAPFFRPAPGRFTVCLLAFACFAAVGGYTVWQNHLWEYLAEVVANLIGKTSQPFPPPGAQALSQLAALSFAFVAFIGTLWLTRDRTAMGVHPDVLQGPLNEPAYGERLTGFCTSLERNLNDIDRDALWSDQYFVPLDAEVEVRRGARGARRNTRLLDALKGHHDQRYFLLLGDPGAGKSVALRKLARDLLKEVRRTGRVPIYLNLRDWRTPPEWSAQAIPTPVQIETELRRWLLADLRERLDRYGFDFLARYFTDMEVQGRFFYILDSFDEIALLLDVDERHPLVDLFSEAIDRFLGGMHRSRGVLASRLFRKPTARLAAPCVLEIRPLSDHRLRQLAERRLARADLTEQLFVRQPELVAAARNPFTAVLLVEYLDDHSRNAVSAVMPGNRGDIFQHHLAKHFTYCREQLKRADLTDEAFLAALETIADTMFQLRTSFEVNVSGVPPLLAGIETATLLDTLKRARLLRVGPGVDPRISFTHRRFAEYLAARGLLKHPGALPLEDIPTDSLWRDTLVLYCEIAPEERARVVAQFCWDQVKQSDLGRPQLDRGAIGGNDHSGTPRWLPALHCLRFLIDAFRARPACLDVFRDELGDKLAEMIENKADPLVSKFAVEACGLMSPEDTGRVLIAALNRNNSFINETVFKACRYDRQPSPQLTRQLCRLLSNKSYLQVWANAFEYYRHFSLAQGYGQVKQHLLCLILDSLTWLAGIVYLIFGADSWFFCLLAFLARIVFSGESWLLTTYQSNWHKPQTSLHFFVKLLAEPMSAAFRSVNRVACIVRLYQSQLSVILFAWFSSLSILASWNSIPEGKPNSNIRVLNVHDQPALWLIIPWVFLALFLAKGLKTIKDRSQVRNRPVMDVSAAQKPAGNSLNLIILGGAALGIAVIAIMMFFVSYGLPWLVQHALAAKTWVGRITYGAIPAILGAMLGLGSIWTIFSFFNDTLKPLTWDALRWLRFSWPREPLSRTWIAESYSQFKSGFWRARFVARLRSSKVDRHDWPSGPPYTDDSRAAAELARLDERWRGLDR